MDPKIKEDWVEALRSGEYVQGGSWLDKDDAQCCLGILCDLLDLDWFEGHRGNRIYKDQGDRNSAYLPRTLAEKLGLADKMGLLATMNDDGATFDEIADYIEAEL